MQTAQQTQGEEAAAAAACAAVGAVSATQGCDSSCGAGLEPRELTENLGTKSNVRCAVHTAVACVHSLEHDETRERQWRRFNRASLAHCSRIPPADPSLRTCAGLACRSLHTAQDAVDTKWVMQQWVARGYPVPKAVLKAVKVAAMAGPEVEAGSADGAAQPVREVFRVPVSSIGSGGVNGGGTGAKKSRKKSASKKGFSRR